MLGAGLDTFGLRNPYRSIGLRVFEVDHPATQAWKQERLAASGITPPAELAFVPVDFERNDLAGQLAAKSFRKDDPALYVWLGVVPYLERQTVFSLLRSVAASAEAGIVFDYSEPPENYAPERRERAVTMAARVAAAGEPWITLLDPAGLAGELTAMGFRHIEDLGPSAMARRYFGAPANAPDSGAGPHILFASTKARA
ncbi:class I SAM-dependent methyltransferase [Rhizobium puerariae]|uniref:S-adenosyl-L-methionine-dependent methyltransferase n=1 Tax=Rhizobium puerariae TaxID=1585791 RepID=A0ABV6AH87_9HYPH